MSDGSAIWSRLGALSEDDLRARAYLLELQLERLTAEVNYLRESEARNLASLESAAARQVVLANQVDQLVGELVLLHAESGAPPPPNFKVAVVRIRTMRLLVEALQADDTGRGQELLDTLTRRPADGE